MTMSMRPETGVELKRWRGRSAVELTNGVVEATLLPGGGHVAAWRFTAGHGRPQANVLWEAPWQTFDPEMDDYARLVGEDGDLGTKRFLASYTGHALCLDGFGSPSAAELALGNSLHGEASCRMWTFASRAETSATGIADLPLARLRVQRDFSLFPGESVLRVDERVTNLSDASRRLHWVQHGTMGAPIFSKGGRVTSSVRDGVTWPNDYEGVNLLKQDKKFTWPLAPGSGGSAVDLRNLFVERGTGFVAAARQSAGREHGFVAAVEPKLGIAMGYLFSSNVFPWVTLWEENRARPDAPWSGQVQARGLEFGTTPLPLGNEAVDAAGPVLGSSTSLKLGPRQSQRAPWMLFLAEIPRGWKEVEDVRAEGDEIVLIYEREEVRLAARGAATFLHATREYDTTEAA